MKIFVLSADFTSDSPAWINIFWPHYNAIAQSVPSVHLSTPEKVKGTGPLPKLDQWQQQRAHAKRLKSQVLAELDPNGPNILLVWALRESDIARAELLEPIWDRFSHHVLAIVDNLQPKHAVSHIKGRYDRITCFCGDLAEKFEASCEIPSLYFPPHTDTLTFHSPSPSRPIDLFIVGRRDPQIYFPIHHHFNQPGQDRFSLDFVSRTRNTSYDSETEFRLLISAYSKAKAAFCFDPSQLDRFHARSPLTERWVHAWTAGTTVIGTTPTGKGVAKAIDWPEATIDLPSDPVEAIEAVDAILSDTDGLERRRIRNVAEAMQRHDTRYRLERLLAELGLETPDGLKVGIETLKDQAAAVLTGR